MSSTAEYDAFGPWIYEVRTQDEIPRVFRGHPIDLSTATMTVKVPRDIERRNANPSMDLYDILLSLGPDSLTVLTRRGRDCDAREVPYRQIQGITEFTDLLDARVTFHTETGVVDVRYNSSSTDTMSHLVQLVRQRYVAGGQGRPAPKGRRQGSSAPDVEDALRAYYRRLAHEEGAGRSLGVQKRHAVEPLEVSAMSRVMARAWPTTLQGAIVTLGERELQVVNRGRAFATGYKPVQSLARTLMPIERISALEVRPSKVYADVSALVVRVGTVEHAFDLDTPLANKIAGDVKHQVRA